MSTVTLIRRAELRDCRNIAEIQVDSYQQAYAGIFPASHLRKFTYEEQEQDWLSLLAADAGDILLIVEPGNNEISGYVLARAERDIYPGYDAEIVALHVRRSYQTRGLGTALLSAAMIELQERGCRSVMLWTLRDNPIRGWYERLGGQLIGEKSYLVDDEEIVEIAYGWDEVPNVR